MSHETEHATLLKPPPRYVFRPMFDSKQCKHGAHGSGREYVDIIVVVTMMMLVGNGVVQATVVAVVIVVRVGGLKVSMPFRSVPRPYHYYRCYHHHRHHHYNYGYLHHYTTIVTEYNQHTITFTTTTLTTLSVKHEFGE